jgi:hypothetical protein
MTAYCLKLIESFAEQANLELAQEPVLDLWSGVTTAWISSQDLLVFKLRF